MDTVPLKTLRRGQWFKIGERKGYLMYANDCRARVKLGGKPVYIKGELAFFVGVEQDWGPETRVTPIERIEAEEVDLSTFDVKEEEVDLTGEVQEEVDLTTMVEEDETDKEE